MNITGTFVQPLCGGDIPVMNWQEKEWDLSMALMKRMGVDTIILLRQALGKWLAYKSDYLMKVEGCFAPSYDYMDMFLRLAEKHGMKMFVPTYSPWHDWLTPEYDPQKEFKHFKPLVDEIQERYGNHPAFAGWYMAQEISGADSYKVIELFQKLAPYCKSISNNLPVLMSPGMRGMKCMSNSVPYEKRKAFALTPEQHAQQWDQLMTGLEGVVDIVAFQDGHVDFEDLEDYQKANVELGRKHGLEMWSNVELFDRDTSFPTFPPIGWEKLLLKLKTATRTGLQKLISYELVPFMCRNSAYPTAETLLTRYCEYAGISLDK